MFFCPLCGGITTGQQQCSRFFCLFVKGKEKKRLTCWCASVSGGWHDLAPVSFLPLSTNDVVVGGWIQRFKNNFRPDFVHLLLRPPIASTRGAVSSRSLVPAVARAQVVDILRSFRDGDDVKQGGTLSLSPPPSHLCVPSFLCMSVITYCKVKEWWRTSSVTDPPLTDALNWVDGVQQEERNLSQMIDCCRLILFLSK